MREWRHTLSGLIDQFFQPDENNERQLQILRHVLEDLGSRGSSANYADMLELPVIQSYLSSQLEQNNHGSGFLAGGVTFCAMLPMRSIPFKVICLIGLNDEAFPRDSRPLNFDIMAQYPQVGDRSRRNDDKYLFLESIISARNRFYVSYIGQDSQDNTPIPPSVLVSELIDSIAARFEKSNPNIVEQVITHHRLQQFSPAYYDETGSLFSYSAENMTACAAARDQKAPVPFFNRGLPVTAAESELRNRVDLDSLCRFFSNPARYLVRKRVGIKLDEEGLLSEEQENFNLQPLERFLIDQNLMQNLISGVNPTEYKPIQKAIGQLPHGHVGDYYYAEMTIETQNFVRQTEKYINAAMRASIEFELAAGGFELNGRLSSISDLGCIYIRYARQRAQDLLGAWICHLIYCHTAPPEYERSSYLICKDAAIHFRPLSDSLQLLEALLEIYRQGLEFPVHFFPETSLEFCEQLLMKTRTPEAALARAVKKWTGSEFHEYSRAESTDPYYDLCFRHYDPLDGKFQKISVAVFEPLLKHSRKIAL